MKKKLLIALLTMTTSLSLGAVSCTCASGQMEVEFKDGKTIMRCVGGGDVICTSAPAPGGS